MIKEDKLLLEMKNTSELMLDLAYSALIYRNKEIAKEVIELEDRVDKLHDLLVKSVLGKNKSPQSFDRGLILINISDTIERIADAALDIADVVLRDIDLHPVVRKSLDESDVVIMKHRIDTNSKLHGKTLGDAKLAADTGIWVIAIRRGSDWIYGPDEGTTISGGDILYARGPDESEKLLYPWIRSK
ncbi:MAG: PhoU domain-containing protein [Thermoplasmata archaeon]